MSINLVTFLSFFWYFLVRDEIIPLAIAPGRDAALNEMVTGKPMNVAKVATLDLPLATLIPLEQAFNHVSRFNILVYFSYFLLKHLFFIYQHSSFSLDHVQMIRNLRIIRRS